MKFVNLVNFDSSFKWIFAQIFLFGVIYSMKQNDRKVKKILTK